MGGLTGTIEFVAEVPVSDAEVFVEGTPCSAATDARGQFVMKHVPPGIYDIQIVASKGQFSMVKMTCSVTSNQVTDLGTVRVGKPGQVCGRVVASEPADVLEAVVGVPEQAIYAQPNAQGYFLLAGIAPGAREVRVFTAGVPGASVRVDVKPGVLSHCADLSLGRPADPVKPAIPPGHPSILKVTPPAVAPPPAPSTVVGVDVTSLAGQINWAKVKSAGNAFAIARASYGLTVDSSFPTNHAGIKSAGLIRGAVHFFQPEKDATAQATLYLNTVGALEPGDLPPILDVEVTNGQSSATIAAGIQTWITVVEKKTNRTPIIYTGLQFWNSNLFPSTFGAQLWIAEWGVQVPRLPNGWNDYVFWQSSCSAAVDGVPLPVNRNVFNGTLQTLRALAKLAP
jgi:lysozyme